MFFFHSCLADIQLGMCPMCFLFYANNVSIKDKKNILIQKKTQKHVVVFWLIGLLFVFKKERLNGAPKLRVALIFPDVFIIISSFFTHIIECWSVPTSKDILENIVPCRPIWIMPKRIGWLWWSMILTFITESTFGFCVWHYTLWWTLRQLFVYRA